LSRAIESYRSSDDDDDDDEMELFAAAAAAGAGLIPSISLLRHVDLLSDSVTLEWEPAPVVEPRVKSYVVDSCLVWLRN